MDMSQVSINKFKYVNKHLDINIDIYNKIRKQLLNFSQLSQVLET